MLSVKEYKHDHTLTQRRAVMLVANHTTPLLGSRAKAMEAAWAFVKKGGAITKAVGVSFGGCQSVLRRLEQHPIQDVGYQLCREPDNPYDPNAVRVDGLLWGRAVGPVGRLPRELAAMLAPLMDRGVAFQVPQHAIYGGGTGYSLGVKLRIRVTPSQTKRLERSGQECRIAG